MGEIAMDLSELIIKYQNLLQPVFGEQLRIDDSDEDRDWVAIILDGKQETFYFSLYGTECVHLYWCNECFIFDKHRNGLVSSDTYGEIVFEGTFDMERLPHLIVSLILQLKDCTYVTKEESVKGKTPSGYDTIKEYLITVKTKKRKQTKYQLANITIKSIV